MILYVKLVFALAATVMLQMVARADSTAARVNALVRASNAWTTGEQIPKELLTFKSSSDGSCFPVMDGTEVILGWITNFALLKEIALNTTIDGRISSNALHRAFVAAGPGKFFEAMRKSPIARQQSWVKHVVVDSLSISLSDMPRDSALLVLEAIKAELLVGRPFDDVLSKYSRTFSESSGRTKIGNLGDFILSENKNALFSLREEWMPKDHVRPLFAAKRGQILTLPDKEDASRYSGVRGDGSRFVLHRVREVYNGR